MMNIGSLLTDYPPLQSFSESGNLEYYSRIVEVDCSNGSVILILPLITNVIPKNVSMLIKRIDDSINDLIIQGTSGNYEDDPHILDGLEGTRIYASNADIWRSEL